MPRHFLVRPTRLVGRDVVLLLEATTIGSNLFQSFRRDVVQVIFLIEWFASVVGFRPQGRLDKGPRESVNFGCKRKAPATPHVSRQLSPDTRMVRALVFGPQPLYLPMR